MLQSLVNMHHIGRIFENISFRGLFFDTESIFVKSINSGASTSAALPLSKLHKALLPFQPQNSPSTTFFWVSGLSARFAGMMYYSTSLIFNHIIISHQSKYRVVDQSNAESSCLMYVKVEHK